MIFSKRNLFLYCVLFFLFCVYWCEKSVRKTALEATKRDRSSLFSGLETPSDFAEWWHGFNFWEYFFGDSDS